VLVDTGALKMWMPASTRPTPPTPPDLQRPVDHGLTVPGAIGAKIARPDEGAGGDRDGSFLMNSQEIETRAPAAAAVRHPHLVDDATA